MGLKKDKIIVDNLILYGVVHALIDASCAGAIFSQINSKQMGTNDYIILVAMYNILAFGMQAPLGFIMDGIKKPKFAALSGCLFTALGVLFYQTPVVAIFLYGIGNALYHLGGGIVALNLKSGKASLVGIFVAPGVVGLLIGTIIGRSGHFSCWIFAILLMAAFISILFIKHPSIDYNIKREIDYNKFELIILLIFISISIRALIGSALNFPWKTNMVLLCLLTFAVFWGKALGGIFADRFGWIKVSLISLIISSVLLSFGYNYVFLVIPGIFLFNMTMPITLTAISEMLHGRAGFAFGLTALALLIGSYVNFIPVSKLFNNPVVIFLIILLSAAILFAALRLFFNNKASIQQACKENKKPNLII